MKTIALTGKYGGYALVDDDKVWLSRYKWYQDSGGYAVRGIRRNKITRRAFLHHAIIGQPLEGETDHINRDKLDDRKSNLRHCSKSFNATNHSNPRIGLCGRNISKCVPKGFRTKPFKVTCAKDGRRIYGGCFKTLEEAKIAAEKLRKQLGYA